MSNQRIFSGIDLLNQVLEFTEMVPDSKQWTLSSVKSNPPRYIRLQQIQSLLNAFFSNSTKKNFPEKTRDFLSGNPSITINSFLIGEFIKLQSREDHALTFQFMREFVEKHVPGYITSEELHTAKLRFVFQKLVDYKRLLRQILEFNSGWIESGSVVAQFSIYLTASISKNLDGNYTQLDKVLELFINPKGLSFTEDELISKYNYPKQSLEEIDIAWL